MVIRNFNLRRSLVRKTWNIRLNQYTMIFGKGKKNLQYVSSFANGCLRWLYPASSKTQVLNFFCCYTTYIIFRKVFLFFIRPSSSQDSEENTEEAFAPATSAPFKLRLWVPPVEVPSCTRFDVFPKCPTSKEKRGACLNISSQ